MPQMWDSLMHATRMLEDAKYGSFFARRKKHFISHDTPADTLKGKTVYALYKFFGSDPPLLQNVEYTVQETDNGTINDVIKDDNSFDENYELLAISFDLEHIDEIYDRHNDARHMSN